MRKILISLSGGMDSTTLLAYAMDSGYDCEGVAFRYGSKHNEFENRVAEQIAIFYKIPFRIIDLQEVMKEFKSNLLKSGGEIPEGHYQDESMSQTVVPGRNIIFLSILSGLAWSIGADEIWIGIHSGDHAIYPDCRPVFYGAMSEAIRFGTDGRVSIQAPFLHLSKADIIKIGLTLKVPYHLSRTCYKAQPIACGRCGSCIERLEAFAINGAEDPIKYEENAVGCDLTSKN